MHNRCKSLSDRGFDGLHRALLRRSMVSLQQCLCPPRFALIIFDIDEVELNYIEHILEAI